MIRTIRVTGTGQMTVQPDTVHLLLTLTGAHDQYGKALEESAVSSGRLKQALAAVGIQPDELKTSLLTIDSKQEGFQDKDGQYKQRFVGFEYVHRLKLIMDVDRDKLGQVLTAFLESGVPVEFQILYQIRDPEAIKGELIKRAVLDAKGKAKNLADAAGVSLGKIMRMVYPREEIPLRHEVMRSARRTAPTAFGAVDPDLEPDDLKFTESVNVIWEIQ